MISWLAYALKTLLNQFSPKAVAAAGCLLAAVLLVSSSQPMPAQAAGFFDKVFGHTIPGNTGQYRRRSKAKARVKAKRPARARKALGIGKMRSVRAKSKVRKAKRAVVKKKKRARKGGHPKGKTFRTMCVRKCDGYFFPVSFSTTRKKLRNDAQVCADSCGVPASLYYYPNPGGSLKKMVSYKSGKSYDKLKNAFRFKKEFVADCRCKPEPWTREAKRVHQRYAALNKDPMKELAAREKKRGKRYSKKSRRKKSKYKRYARKASAKKYVRSAPRKARTSGKRYYRKMSARRKYYLRNARGVGRR